jgi:transcriptional regulator with XRE-family HTH domain
MKHTSGERLKKLIKALDLQQNTFAKSIGKSPQNISAYIRGEYPLGKNYVESIKENFNNVNVEWLLYGVGDMFINESQEVQSDVNTEYNKSASKNPTSEKVINNPADGESGISEFDPKEAMVIDNNKSLQKLQFKVGAAQELLKIVLKTLEPNTKLATETTLIKKVEEKLDEINSDIEKSKLRYSLIIKNAVAQLNENQN